MATQPTFFKNGIDCSCRITFRVLSGTHNYIPSCRSCGLLRAGQDPSANQPLAASTRREPHPTAPVRNLPTRSINLQLSGDSGRLQRRVRMNAVHRRHGFIIVGLHNKGCWGFAGYMQVRRQLLDLFGTWFLVQNVFEVPLSSSAKRPDDWTGKYSEIRTAAGPLNGVLRGWISRIEMRHCLRC